MNALDYYNQTKTNYTDLAKKEDGKLGKLTFLRFILGFTTLILVYNAIVNATTLKIVFIALLILGFAVLVYFFRKSKAKIQRLNLLVEINKIEIEFLESNTTPFTDGIEFEPENHPYCSDIDVLGKNSLYQHLNRTESQAGKRKLAETLLFFSEKEKIQKRQKAIAELNDLIDWRQQFTVACKLGKDEPKVISTINTWQNQTLKIDKILRIGAYILPIICVASLLLYFVVQDPFYLKITGVLFAFNLSFSSPVIRKIMKELKYSGELGTQFKSYSEIIHQIEIQDFESELLNELKSNLNHSNKNASVTLNELGTIFNHLENIANLPVLLIANGFFCFHVHQYRKLVNWKKNNTINLSNWINLIGDFEELNSFANFKFNNPEYVFPHLANSLSFDTIHHPLLKKTIAVGNSIDFSNQGFTILTGSNMSGKSTFLRTIGIGMVLSNSGSVVSAKEVSYLPIPFIATMRLSDSLSDATSYFYAEVKRLNQIIQNLEKKPYFVLLDEILRGTNSDDKLEGTLGVVKKLARMNTNGMIATHDLAVCELSKEFPEQLINRCFEVELLENDLQFDYTLREGVCKNKSATFIMRKMGVIE